MQATTLHAAAERGQTRIDWLDSRHTFSFGGWRAPGRDGFSALRVINDDRVRGGGGFPRHPHRDMEIISYVVDGALAHRDSLGNGSVIAAGDVQRMTAGTGIEHSEFNASETEPVRFLQIWIPPATRGLRPGYAQATFDPDARRNRVQLLVTPDGADGSITVHRDVRVAGAVLDPGATVEWPIGRGRRAFVQMVRGRATVGGRTLASGDGLALPDGGSLRATGVDAAEPLFFDLP